MAKISEKDQRILQLKLRNKKLRHLEKGIEDLKTNSGDFAELSRQLAEGKKAKSDKRSAGEVKRLKRVLLRKKDKGYTADRRKGIYVNEEYKDKRKAIYVERTMASHSGDDERTPLLGNEGVKPIMDQIKRLRKEEDDLLVQSDALSASAAAFQKTEKKPSLWERICCCCCSGSDKDDT